MLAWSSVVPLCTLAASSSLAQSAPTGAAPADEKALVSAPKADEEPAIDKKLDGTTVAVSAGGLLSSGNSRLLAGTLNGAFETRFHDNGIGASILGNYGQGAPPGQPVHVTTENLQGRVRYDRYVVDEVSLFVINTGRHDRLQGIDFRYNLDPGVKYLFLKEHANALWTEGGYDFQYDIRRDDALVVLDASGNPVLDANGQPTRLEKTATDHSTRLFVGYKHGWGKQVTLATGLEYLQSVIDSKRYRINFDMLFAAQIGGGLSIGVGIVSRFDNAPLPGKEKTDTATTLSLIYSYSDVPEPKKPKMCPCPSP
jgi:putative salt-induced outer membrane protein